MINKLTDKEAGFNSFLPIKLIKVYRLDGTFYIETTTESEEKDGECWLERIEFSSIGNQVFLAKTADYCPYHDESFEDTPLIACLIS